MGDSHLQWVLRPWLLTPGAAPQWLCRQSWPGPQQPCSPFFRARQQELDNLLHEKRYLRALGLAISLDWPHTVLTVVQGQCCPGGRLGRGSPGLAVPLPQAQSSLPCTAIRRDPEACEKLEATVLRLRRDQKGLGWACGAGQWPGKSRVVWGTPDSPCRLQRPCCASVSRGTPTQGTATKPRLCWVCS